VGEVLKMASMSRSTSRLGEERIPLSFKVVVEPELGTTRPAGTSGEDFKASRMVCCSHAAPSPGPDTPRVFDDSGVLCACTDTHCTDRPVAHLVFIFPISS